MQNTNILLFVRYCPWRTEGTLNFGMVRFPTGHYWHCEESVSTPGMYWCKWWTFWTPFV